MSSSFNKRYFVIGALIYILSVYIAFDCDIFLTGVKPIRILKYTATAVSVFAAAYIILRIIFSKSRGALSLCNASFVVILIFIFGFTNCTMYIHKDDKKTDIISKAVGLDGKIAQDLSVWSNDESYGMVIDVHRAHLEGSSITFDKPCYAIIYINKEDLISPPGFGDTVSCSIRHFEDTKPAYEDAFVFSEKLRQDKIIYNAYGNKLWINDELVLEEKQPVIFKLKSLGLKIRNAVLNSTEIASYGNDEKALLRGILVGDRLEFPDELYAKYKASGFIHIASVSGMHTSYLFLVISILLGLLRFPRRGICFIAIPVLVLFAAVAMFTPSVCRSVIMMIVMLIAAVIRRDNDSITSLSVAALLLSLENPYCLQSYSFLLSFSATLGILVYYSLLRQRLEFAVVPMKEGKKHGFIRKSLYSINKFSVNSICLSIGGTIGLSYFMMRFYGVLRWGSIIGNIPVFPLTAISFIGGYANSLMYYISKPIAEVTARFIVNPALWMTNKLADIFSADFFGINTPSPSKTFFIVYIFICVVIYYWLLPDKQK